MMPSNRLKKLNPFLEKMNIKMSEVGEEEYRKYQRGRELLAPVHQRVSECVYIFYVFNFMS